VKVLGLGGEVVATNLERLTRFYLQNHFLADQAGKSDVLAVVGKVCGLQSQLPMTPYYSLWSRVKEFEPEVLDRLLYTDKSLTKTWFMRGTLHMIPSQDLPVYHNALRRMWFEHHGRYMNEPGWPSREDRKRKLYPKIKEALAEKPLRRKELCDRVRVLLADESQPYEKLFSAWGGILKETSYLGLTVHGEPCGREACFARLDEWLPHVDLNDVSETEARRQLLKKYLRGYGPASAQDFACWSGMLTSEANKTIEGSKGLKQVQLEGSHIELWMLEEDFRALEKVDVEAQVSPRLLPKYDSYLMGHKNRSRIIQEEALRKVYRPVVGEVAAAVLINGRIVATWTSKKTRRILKIIVSPLEKLSDNALATLRPVADELALFLGIKEAQLTLSPR
jgi:uncharacterized protein YcaQ